MNALASLLSRRLLLMACVVLLFGCGGRPVSAQEDADDASAEKAVEDGAESAVGELPTLPKDGSEEDLLTYINEMVKLIQGNPQGETDEEKSAFRTESIANVARAADLLIKADSTDEQLIAAYNFRLQSLGYLSSMGDEKATKDFDKAVAAARKDEREAVQRIGWRGFLEQRLGSWGALSEAERRGVIKQVVAKVKKGPTALDAAIVGMAASNLEQVDESAALELLKATYPLIEKSDDDAVKKEVEDRGVAGLYRRLNLPGHPIEITGTLLDGKEVEWESYRGKVVLVDFWASWCGPCKAEVPNIIAMYKGYHEKGFDVLGVSLDQTLEAAQKGTKEEGLLWPSIFSDKDGERYWDAPLVRYYGIRGIPTAILVDQEGKVVEMNARGEVLQQRLQELLGDPIETAVVEGAEAEEPATEETAVEVESETES